MGEKNFESVFIGKSYERRDGRLAIVYGYDSVHNWYNCVILGSQEFFTVYENGQYLESKESHNDLVKEI